MSALLKLNDEIQTNVRYQHNLGVGGDTFEVIVTPLILHQLRPKIRDERAGVGEDHLGDSEKKLPYDEI